MRFWHILIMFFAVVALTAGVYNLYAKSNDFKKETAELKISVKKISDENEELVSKIEYFKRPENLLKELKSQFNYVESGEKLIIIVPQTTTTNSR